MTFFDKADRFKEGLTDGPGLGPGEYLSHKEYRIPHGVVGFGSTVEKNKVEVKEEKDKDLIKEKQFYDEVNKEFINEVTIKKQNSVFASKTKRFKEDEVGAKSVEEQVPGPGNYNIASFTEELNRKMIYKHHIDAAKSEKQRQIENLKGLNDKRMGIPSIPGREQKLGYTVADGELKLNTKADGYDGTKVSSVGPGQYNIPTSIDPSKMRGVQWKNSSVKASTRNPSGSSSSVGPWSYNPNKDFKPLYKYKQSAAFASETPRKFFERENISIASRKTKWSLNDDEDESEYIEDATPGPGYYYAPEAMTSFKKQSKEHQYQIFTTGSERFPQQTQGYQNLGPGKYYRDKGMVPKTFNRVLEHGGRRTQKSGTSAAVEAKRDAIKQENIIPGPGYYENKNTIKNEVDKKVEKATFMPFLSSSFRFQNPVSSNENPGPGAYYSPEDKVDIVMDGEKQRNFNYFFKSNSKRSAFGERGQLETPVVGKYNLDQFDIGKGVLKYRAEPADLKDPKLGFDSKAPRFKEIKEEDNEEFDDGQDNHVKKIFDQLPTFKAYKDEAAKQQANRKKMQLRNLKKRETQRFKEDLKNPTPGPGAYYSKRQPNWDKPTFNSYYHKFDELY